jgi:hypothetical protein
MCCYVLHFSYFCDDFTFNFILCLSFIAVESRRFLNRIISNISRIYPVPNFIMKLASVCVCVCVCVSQRRSQCSGAFAKLGKTTIDFVMAVDLHGTARLLLDGFSRNFIFMNFLKICRENIQA